VSLVVIGIDPGSERSGFAKFRVAGRPYDTVSTVLEVANMMDNDDIVGCLAMLPPLGGYRVVIENPWVATGKVFPAVLKTLQWAFEFKGIIEGLAYCVKGELGALRVNMIQSSVVRAWLFPVRGRETTIDGKRKKPTDGQIRKAVEAKLGQTLDVPSDQARHVADACAVALMWMEGNRSMM